MSEEDIVRYSYESRDIKQICFYKNGKLSQVNQPARIDILDQVIIKYWYKDGLLHNDYYPAMEIKFIDGKCMQEWYNEGCLHRLGGSALSNNQSYYIYGKRYEEKKYFDIMDRIKKFIKNTRQKIVQRRLREFLSQEICVYEYISCKISSYI